MRNFTFVFILFLFSFTASAQMERKNDLVQVSVFPNPAADFIALNNDDNAKNILVFNLIGRKLKHFDVEKGEHYDISDLPNGLYMIQVVNKNNKVVTTQRLAKRDWFFN